MDTNENEGSLQKITMDELKAQKAAMSKFLSQKATMREAEFCKIVGISRTTAWRERKAGRLPFCRIGDKVVYLPRHIDEFLANVEQLAKAGTNKR